MEKLIVVGEKFTDFARRHQNVLTVNEFERFVWSGELAGAESPAGPLSVGALVMWPQMRRAQWQGQPLALTSTEFNLLELLARNAGRVVGKPELSEQGLGRPLARFDRSIDVHLSSIRHKLGARPDGRSWIETVRGQGYLMVRE